MNKLVEIYFSWDKISQEKKEALRLPELIQLSIMSFKKGNTKREEDIWKIISPKIERAGEIEMELAWNSFAFANHRREADLWEMIKRGLSGLFEGIIFWLQYRDKPGKQEERLWEFIRSEAMVVNRCEFLYSQAKGSSRENEARLLTPVFMS